MRVKLVVFVLLAFFGAAFSFAQGNFGIKAGYGIGNVEIEASDFEELIEGDNIQGYEAGVFVNYQWSNLYLRPELLYMYREGDVEANQESEIRINRFQVPLIAGIRILGPLWIEGGPTYHYTTSFYSEFDNDMDIQRSGFGYRIGPNVQFGRFNIFANYEGYAFSSGSGTQLREPYRINGGIGIMFGGI